MRTDAGHPRGHPTTRGAPSGEGDRPLLTDVAPIDAVLDAHAEALGRDRAGYGNHAYRVTNLCAALAPLDAEELEKVAIAAAFHDLGIWTAGTFDYLRPSSRLAVEHLLEVGRLRWADELEAMVLAHHKISPHRGRPLVELFRRADWVDVSRGLFTFGLPRRFLARVFSAWPSAGFHRRLVQLTLERTRTHPWSPLPMVRL